MVVLFFCLGLVEKGGGEGGDGFVRGMVGSRMVKELMVGFVSRLFDKIQVLSGCEGGSFRTPYIKCINAEPSSENTI